MKTIKKACIRTFDLIATIVVLGSVFVDHLEEEGLGAFCLSGKKKK